MTNSMQKNKISLTYFQRYWWSKNPAIRLNKRRNWLHSNKEVVPHDTFAWWLSTCKKSKGLLDFFQRYWWSKNHEIWLDKKHNCSQTTKSGSLRCYQCKKSKRSIEPFQRDWSPKNTAIWLAESILGHNWRTRFFQDTEFLQHHTEHCCASFLE